jgi:LPS export ABC transporter protein LptC
MKVVKLIFIVLFLSGLIISGCSERNEIKAPGVGQDDSTAVAVIRPDQQLNDAHIELFNGSIRTTDIKAKHIDKYTKQDSTLAWGLNVHFYDRDGKKTSHLVADSGLIRESIKLMIANGHVVVVDEYGTKLETEQLFWNGTNDRVTTDKFVTIYQDGDTLMGTGFESGFPFKGFKIKHGARGTYQNVNDIKDE